MLPFFKAKPKAEHLDAVEVVPYEEKHLAPLMELLKARFAEINAHLDLKGDDEDLTDIPYFWQRKGAFFILLREGKLVGSLGIRPEEKEPHIGRCSWFFLDPKAEGKGLSLYLIKAAYGWCKAHGINRVELWTSERRWWAHKIYKKFGFVHNGIKRPHDDKKPAHYLLLFELIATPEIEERIFKLCEKL